MYPYYLIQLSLSLSRDICRARVSIQTAGQSFAGSAFVINCEQRRKKDIQMTTDEMQKSELETEDGVELEEGDEEEQEEVEEERYNVNLLYS